jgi:hypothetical protein
LEHDFDDFPKSWDDQLVGLIGFYGDLMGSSTAWWFGT